MRLLLGTSFSGAYKSLLKIRQSNLWRYSMTPEEIKRRRTLELLKDKKRKMQAHDRQSRAKREKDWGKDYWAAEQIRIKRLGSKRI